MNRLSIWRETRFICWKFEGVTIEMRLEKKNLKLLLIITLVAVIFCLLALTAARPITAKIYHKVRDMYTDYTTRQEVEELYLVQKSNGQAVDIAQISLAPVASLTEDEENSIALPYPSFWRRICGQVGICMMPQNI